ncbi:hypothetical protein PR048_028824 [Dryococelus australis]|uniref:Gag protein n=1 Tax=Dryococelus australis TaxID=614101 RepID=A0ABQ9GBL8_9NEOP|nr:hypothetical protein PR048_028824 [Dryococelus australis]
MDGLIGGQADTKLSGEADWATWKFKLISNLTTWHYRWHHPPLVKEKSKQIYEKWARKGWQSSNELSVDLAKQNFFEVKYNKNEAMSEYLGRVDAILDNLKSLGADVNESMAITKIISSLPG